MRFLSRRKLSILFAWGAVLGLLGYLAANPRHVAPYASRLVGKHLLGMERGGIRVRDFRVRVFEGMDLYGVSLSLPTDSGGMTLVAADTVTADFSILEVLGVVPRLRRVVVSRPEVYSRAGEKSDVDDVAPGNSDYPRLSIENLIIRDAFLEFSGSDGRLTERIRQLDWQGSVHSDKTIELGLRGCSVDWETHDSRLDRLRGKIVIDNDKFEASPVFGLFNDHPAKVSGSRHWDGRLDIAVMGEGVSVAEVEDLIDMTIGFNAQGDLTATFVSDGDTTWYEGIFKGELEGYDVEVLQGEAVITQASVDLSNLDGRINGASFTGSGAFDIRNTENVTYVLEGNVRDADLAKGLVPGEDELPVTDGHGYLRIEHADRPMWTRVSGVLHDGFIDIIPFDSCYVDVEAWTDSVELKRIELFEGDLHVLLDGVSSADRVFRGEISAGSADLSSLPATWDLPPLRGRLSGQGRLMGPLEDLDFIGWASIHGLKLDQVAAGFSEAALVIENVLEDPHVTADVGGRDLQVGKVPLGDYLLRGAASSTYARVDSFRSDLGDTTVAFRLGAVFTDSVSHYRLEDYLVSMEGTDWSLEQPVDFDLGPGYLDVPAAALVSSQGTLRLNGRYVSDGLVSGAMELRSFDMGLLDPFFETQRSLNGTISADVALSGTSAAPVIDLDGHLTDAAFELAEVDWLHLDVGFSQGSFDIRSFDLQSDYGQVRGSGTVSHPGTDIEDFWPGAELDLDVSVQEGDWLFLEQFELPALDRLNGVFSGDLQVAGTTRDPLIVGSLRSAPFDIHWLHLDSLTGQVHVTGDELVLADLAGVQDNLNLSGRIEVPLEFDLLSEPVTPLDGPFYMQLEVPPGSNLEPLSRATNAFVQSSGTGEAHVIVSGPLDHPFYQGRVKIEKAGFVLRDLEEIYADVSCEGTLRGDKLLIRNITGREGLRGTFDGEGSVTFKGLVLETFDVRLNLDRFLVASIPDLRAVVNSRNGRLTGVKVGPDSLLVPRFTGDFEVVKGIYTGDFQEKGGGNDPMAATVAPDWVGNMHIHGAPRTVRIINRELELNLGGDLDLSRDEGGMYLRGSLDVNSGKFYVFANTFDVLRGKLDFSREVGFDPRLDLDAETRYRLRSKFSSNTIIEHIGVHVGGTILEPVITFSSQRGYSREAIQRMLLGLEPDVTPEGDSARLYNASIGAGFNVLEREIAREFDIIDTFEIDQIQRQRATGDTGIDPLIGVGKYLGSDLYFKYAQGISRYDRDFLVEYQINQHLLLQSEIRRRIDENLGNPTYNLDLKYRVEY